MMPNSARDTYNSFIASNVCHFLNAAGIFNLLQAGGERGLALEEIDQHHASFELGVILSIAERLKILTRSADARIHLTPYGKDLYINRGFFTWAVGGYSAVFSNMHDIVSGELNPFEHINSANVAIGSNECGEIFMQETIDRAIDGLGVSKIVDLGCGNGMRLIHQLKRDPNRIGLGIDISSSAITLAQANNARWKLVDRLTFVCDNVFNAISSDVVADPEAELLTSYMMFHDLLNINDLEGRIFSSFLRRFPNLRYIVIGDTFRAPDGRGDADIFEAGFELLHGLTKVKIFLKSDYERIFVEHGLKIEQTHYLGVPNTYLFVLKVPR